MQSLIARGLVSRTLIMGVLNITPDSFSDGGLYFAPRSAVSHALQMLDEGADIIDIGGESTRPATFSDQSPLDASEERRRVAPVIREINAARPDALISIDTYKSEVAKAAIDCGAGIINDISGLAYDPKMLELAARTAVPVVVMHLLGQPRSIPLAPEYTDVVSEIEAYFVERIARCEEAGIDRSNIILDPGIGFGKTADHNFEIVRRLREFTKLGQPLLVGPSRKSFIGKALGGLPPDDRLAGTCAATALCIANGADIVRVHDVRELSRVARVADAIVRSPQAVA